MAPNSEKRKSGDNSKIKPKKKIGFDGPPYMVSQGTNHVDIATATAGA